MCKKKAKHEKERPQEEIKVEQFFFSLVAKYRLIDFCLALSSHDNHRTTTLILEECVKTSNFPTLSNLLCDC